MYYLSLKLSNFIVAVTNNYMNIYPKPKIKINSCYILKTFEKFYLKVVNSRLILDSN